MFKEFATSLQDTTYGNTIISKTAGNALWYFTKFLFLLFTIGFIISIGAIVYFTPQIASTVDKQLPPFDFKVTEGKFSTTMKQPISFVDKSYAFVVDTKGTGKELDLVYQGILVLEDRVLIKDKGQLQEFKLAELGQNVSFEKQMVVTWFETNKILVAASLIGLSLILVLIFGLLTWIQKVIFGLFLAIFVWLAAKLLKKTLNYSHALSLVLYASVLPLILSLLSMFSGSQNQLVAWLPTIFLVLYSGIWLYGIKQTSK